MADAKIEWDDDAKRRLGEVPFFVRPLVRSRAERAARERGLQRVTVELLADLKKAEHRGG